MRTHLPILIALLTFSPHAFPTSLVNIPLDHWSYQFVERLQAKGALSEHLSNSKPYSRGEMAEMLAHTLLLLENNRIQLTNVEIALLEEMEREFARELAEMGNPSTRKREHLLDWTDEGRVLIASIEFAQDISLNPDNGISTLESFLYGDITRNISFHNYSRASYEVNKKTPIGKENDPRYLPWRQGWNGSSDAYVAFGNLQTSIQAGKDAILWGVGYHGVIGLAGIEPTFDIVKLHTRMWKVDFTSLLGFLRDDLTKKYQSDTPRKYLSAHRVEITPYPGVCIAWQEVYIYAEKLQFQLLNPIIPYQMAEDYLGEIGNNTMEGDIEVALIPGVKMYTALFLDDFHTDLSPFKYPGFGWAVLYGTMIADPFGLDNTDVRLEYARVEPWVYAHKGMGQNPPVPTAYKHFDEPLGHWIGPNADDLFSQIGWRINKNIHGKISYNRIRHGEIGGSMYDVDYSGEKKFLGGIVESKRIFNIGLEYTTFHKLKVSADYSYTKIKNQQKEEAKLPKDDERKQDWRPGWNTIENVFRIEVRFRY